MKSKLIFMGTPEFAVPILAALIKQPYNVIAVYTQPDKQAGRGQKLGASPVKELALHSNITVIQPPSLKTPEEVAKMKELAPDVVVVAAYGKIIPQGILSVPQHGFLNVHPSLLPQYRGATPIPSAILNGDTVTGMTIMLLDAGMDSGAIFKQREVSVTAEDTTGSLSARLAAVGTELLLEVLPLWLEGSIKPQPQQHDQATYTRTITKDDGRIDWQQSAVEVDRKIRAYNPWPGCYTYWRGKNLKIIQAIPVLGETSGIPGNVIALPGSPGVVLGVECGKDILGLLRIQMEGKREISAQEFVRGQREFMGSVLL